MLEGNVKKSSYIRCRLDHSNGQPQTHNQLRFVDKIKCNSNTRHNERFEFTMDSILIGRFPPRSHPFEHEVDPGADGVNRAGPEIIIEQIVTWRWTGVWQKSQARIGMHEPEIADRGAARQAPLITDWVVPKAAPHIARRQY